MTRSGSPRVGVVAGWFDPEDTAPWSGVPASIIGQLRDLVDYTGVLPAIPFVPLAKAVHGSRKQLGRLPEAWPLTPEMRLLSGTTSLVRRRRPTRGADAWIHFCGGYGPMVNGRYVAVGEVAPSLIASQPQWAWSFGFLDAGPRQLRWVARRQLDTYRRAYACCVASRWTADGLVGDGIDHRKMRIVGYGSNLGFVAPPERDWSQPRFLFVGRDWERKNGDAVVRAFTNIRRKIPSAQLDVVGQHPDIRVSGVSGHGPLSVFDAQDRARLERLFGTATCFVMPSFLEPFGIVYVEAAKVGLASVATSRGGTRDSVGDGGILVDPNDEDDIQRAMLEMCDPDTARQLGANALRRSPLFSWRSTAQRIVRALDLGCRGQEEMADFLD